MENEKGTVYELDDVWVRRPRRRLTPKDIVRIVNRRRVLFWGLAIAAMSLIVLAPGNTSAATAQEKLNQTITNIQTFMVGIGVALAGILLVIAGTKWMSTKGRPEEQSRVKGWLFDIGFGVVLILSSSVIIEIAKGLIVK